MTDRRRGTKPNSRLVGVLIAASSVLMLMAMLVSYLGDVVFDSDEAGDLAVKALDRPEIRSAIAGQVVDQIVVHDAELLVVRPVVELTVDQVLQSPEVGAIVRFGVADLHRTVFLRGDDTLTVKLADLVLLVRVSLAKFDPELAELIPADAVDAAVGLRSSPAFLDALQLAESVRFLAFLLPIVSLGGFALAIFLSDDRQRSFIVVGLAVVAVAATALLLKAIAKLAFVRQFPGGESREVAGAAWDVVFADLAALSWLVAATGSVLVVVAAASGRRFSLRQQVAAAARAVEPPESRWGRLVWGLAALVVGGFLVADGEALLRLGLVVAGVGLITAGLLETVGALTGAPVRSGTDERAAGAVVDVARSAPFRWALGGLAAVALLALILVSVDRSGGDGDISADGGPGCNGSVVLCGRPLDRVALAATHNSMAAADDGFIGAYQTVGIVPQLDDGYRGLLIDAYYGIESSSLVFTDRAPITAEERSRLVADVGESTVRAAEALRESLESTGGDRDVFLCHSFCEWGAVKAVDEFTRIREWLEANPREVLVLVVQDEGPTEEDMERVFEASGLMPYLHSQAMGEPWPTLGEMIDSGHRIWVSAENSPGRESWYHDAFTFIQDTPFSQPDVESFTCELNRGDPDSPLLLVNHWLSPVSPASADQANSREVLEARLGQCDTERERFVNLIAVDFSDRGDVVNVVAELNGVAIR